MHCSFVVFDREGEMQTIISPLLPSIVKVLQKEEEVVGGTERTLTEDSTAQSEAAEAKKSQEKKATRTPVGAFIAMGIIIGLFAIVGMGTFTLFRGEPIQVKEQVNTDKVLAEALAPFPSVRHSFNNKTGQLLLVGHVLTVNDKNQLLYNLQGLDFIKSIDDSGIVIDQLVWKEMNQVLHRNRTWKGVNVQSVSPGRFVITGYLTTRAQSENLSDYVTSNFPYLELLENRVVVEQDIIAGIESQLHNNGVVDVIVRMSNGEVVLTGEISGTVDKEYKNLLQTFRQIPGVRSLKNYVTELGPKETMVNLSDKYTVTGLSRIGKQVHVVIKGKILAPGDILDGMTVDRIEDDAVFLERGGITYRIDF